MAIWKPKGSMGGISIGKSSSPFTTQEMMGGGGGSGSAHWGFKIPRASTGKNPGIPGTYGGRRKFAPPSSMEEPSYNPAKSMSGPPISPASNKVPTVGKGFSGNQAKLRASDRKITVEQHQRDENAEKVRRRISEEVLQGSRERGYNRYMKKYKTGGSF